MTQCCPEWYSVSVVVSCRLPYVALGNNLWVVVSCGLPSVALGNNPYVVVSCRWPNVALGINSVPCRWLSVARSSILFVVLPRGWPNVARGNNSYVVVRWAVHRLTKTGSTEGVVRVNQKTEGATNQIKQRESSHEYDWPHAPLPFLAVHALLDAAKPCCVEDWRVLAHLSQAGFCRWSKCFVWIYLERTVAVLVGWRGGGWVGTFFLCWWWNKCGHCLCLPCHPSWPALMTWMVKGLSGFFFFFKYEERRKRWNPIKEEKEEEYFT